MFQCDLNNLLRRAIEQFVDTLANAPVL